MNPLFSVFMVSAIVLDNVEKVQGACNSKLENKFEELLNLMLKIKGKGHDNRVGQTYQKTPAFSASLTYHKTLGSGEIVKFDKVWTNILHGYDANTGVFTAPRTGVYQFSCTVMTQTYKTVRVHLWKNNMKTVAVYGNKGHHTGTLNMVLELRRNDRVYIKEAIGQKHIYSEPKSNFSMFSGYLIA